MVNSRKADGKTILDNLSISFAGELRRKKVSYKMLPYYMVIKNPIVDFYARYINNNS